MLELSSFTELVLDLSVERGRMMSNKDWFIKFYAPWCGHCQRLAPVWSEFNRLHHDEINVGLVDCTSEGGQPLCSKMEVRGYPTLLFFPKEIEGDRAKAYKFSGPRTMESLEMFALQEGWRSASADSEVPVNLSGIEAWARWFAQQKIGVMRDIDFAWSNYGLYNYVPAPYHYWVVTLLCCLPFALVLSLLCCIGDEEELVQKPQYGADQSGKKVLPTAPKKTSVRAEKLD